MNKDILKEFDEKFMTRKNGLEISRIELGEDFIFDLKDIKQFISETLQKRDKEVIEMVEKIKKRVDSYANIDDIEIDIVSRERIKDYLDSLLKQLKE